MECKNPLICRKHGVLVSLPEHANNIYRFLMADNPYDKDATRDWFRICSRIEKVSYSEGLHDNAFIVCGPAGDYDDAMSKHLETLLLQLTWFTYIWGGFEAFVDNLNLSDCPHQRGKFNKVCFYLQSEYEPNFKLPDYYVNLVTLLTNYLKETPSFIEDKNIFNSSLCSGKSGNGLTLVYKIRNGFAHGAFEFGGPDEYALNKSYHTRIIHISCRIILITMQMLLLAIHKEDQIEIEPYDWDLIDNENTISSFEFLQKLHLKDFKS